jgi:hypothetical protein
MHLYPKSVHLHILADIEYYHFLRPLDLRALYSLSATIEFHQIETVSHNPKLGSPLIRIWLSQSQLDQAVRSLKASPRLCASKILALFAKSNDGKCRSVA